MALQDPIQEDLWKNNHFNLIVHDCFRMMADNKHLQGLDYEDYPKAIQVPVTESGLLEAKAFHSTARVRHVRLEAGFCTVSPQSWRYCHFVRIVKLPDMVVAIGYAAFQGCHSLQVIEMPGCVELGVRVFSECCALERVGNILDGGSYLAIGTIIGQYAFEECAKLAHLSLPNVRAEVDSATLATPQAGIPRGFASGIQQVELGGDTCRIGHRAPCACWRYRQLALGHDGGHLPPRPDLLQNGCYWRQPLEHPANATQLHNTQPSAALAEISLTDTSPDESDETVPPSEAPAAKQRNPLLPLSPLAAWMKRMSVPETMQRNHRAMRSPQRRSPP